MNTKRINEIWAGVFYIIATVAPILAYVFISFIGEGVSGDNIPNYLVFVSEKEKQVIIGMLIELTWALAVIFIPVSLFSILKQHNETLTIGFFGLRSMESISVMIHSIILLLLVTLSQDYAAATNPERSHFITTITLFLAMREWIFLIGSGVIWTISALILNYLLYQSKLIPRWLSVWGMIGAGLSFVYYLPRFFSIEMFEVLIFPIAVQEIVFAVWLIAKGFRPSQIPSRGAT